MKRIRSKRKEFGFTGTRSGMTEAQADVVRDILCARGVFVGHHGDCVGADAQFDEICRRLGIYRVAHPPTYKKLRAFCDAEFVTVPKDYLARDRDIVEVTRALIAAPKEYRNVKRSGTWYTIRYARNRGKHVMIVFPNGVIQHIISARRSGR